MFGLFSQLISAIAAFLFPIFASYKALKANDPTQLTPWLMYWVVIAGVVVVENFLGWFLYHLPLYQETKMFFMLWLVLPQTQGATYLYLTYVHPYISSHETEIENVISTGHDRLKNLSIIYLRRLYAYIQQLLGITPDAQARPPTPPQTPAQPQSTIQSLLANFSLPPIDPFVPDISSFLPSWTSGDATAPAASASAGSMTSPWLPNFQLPTLPRDQKLTYIEEQKRKFTEYIRFLDVQAEQHKEEQNTGRPASSRTSISGPPSKAAAIQRGSISGNSAQLPPNYTDEGFEAVTSDDISGVLATGIKIAERTAAQPRGWFGWRSVSAPVPKPTTPQHD